MAALVVFPKFNSPTVFPSESDPIPTVDDQLPRNEAGVPKFLFRHLAFAGQRLEVGTEGDFSGRNMIVPRNLHSLNVIPTLLDFDHLVKVPAVMADPFAGKVQNTGGRTRLMHGWIK